jgi:hypothetical protein
MNRIAKATLLFCFFCVCGAAFVVSHRMRERLPAPLPRELFSVVHEQVVAFRADDFRSAYRYAATGLQQKFTLPQFERMARSEYDAVVRAQRVEFGGVKIRGSSAYVQVFFVAGNGSVRAFTYSLVREEQGWKISGVEELEHYQPNERLTGLHV